MEELERDDSHGVHISPVVLVVAGVSCFLSIVGSTLIIFTYCMWREFRNRPREILLCLSISDLILVVSYFYGMMRHYEENTVDCVAQSFFSTIANLSTMLWTMALLVYLFIVIVLMDRKLADSMLPICHAVCWGVPTFMAVLLVSLDGLGFGGNVITVGWCWINVQHHYFLTWMLVAGVIWDIVAYILFPVILLLIHSSLIKQIKMSHELPEDQKHNVFYLGEIDNKLLWLPLVFVLLRIWGTVRFFLYVSGARESPYVSNEILLAMQGIGSTLQGAVNALLCCFLTKHVRHRLVPHICCFIAPRNTTLGVRVDDEDQTDGSTDNDADTNESITLIRQQANSAIY